MTGTVSIVQSDSPVSNTGHSPHGLTLAGVDRTPLCLQAQHHSLNENLRRGAEAEIGRGEETLFLFSRR